MGHIADLIVASEDAYFQDPVLLMGIPGVEYWAHPFELPPRAGVSLSVRSATAAPLVLELVVVRRVAVMDFLPLVQRRGIGRECCLGGRSWRRRGSRWGLA